MTKRATAVLQQIDLVLQEVQERQREPDAHPFLPVVVESLENMKNNVDTTQERRRQLAGALGRILTEDYEFAESPLGGRIIDAANAFADMR